MCPDPKTPIIFVRGGGIDVVDDRPEPQKWCFGTPVPPASTYYKRRNIRTKLLCTCQVLTKSSDWTDLIPIDIHNIIQRENHKLLKPRVRYGRILGLHDKLRKENRKCKISNLANV